jgi:predicted RNase H-like HicB family nuclease
MIDARVQQLGRHGYVTLSMIGAGRRHSMTTYQFTVVIEPDEEGYHAFVPTLPGCHSFGATIDEARTNIAEAMELHVESMQQDGETIPVEREPIVITRLSVPVAA